MNLYIKYFVVWLLFMAIIAIIALVVPKFSAVIDKQIEKFKRPKDTEIQSEQEKE